MLLELWVERGPTNGVHIAAGRISNILCEEKKTETLDAFFVGVCLYYFCGLLVVNSRHAFFHKCHLLVFVVGRGRMLISKQKHKIDTKGRWSLAWENSTIYQCQIYYNIWRQKGVQENLCVEDIFCWFYRILCCNELVNQVKIGKIQFFVETTAIIVFWICLLIFFSILLIL